MIAAGESGLTCNRTRVASVPSARVHSRLPAPDFPRLIVRALSDQQAGFFLESSGCTDQEAAVRRQLASQSAGQPSSR